MKTQKVFQNASLVSVVNGSIVVKSAAGIEHTFTNASVVSVNNGTIIIETEWKLKKGELVKITGTGIDAYSIFNKIDGDLIYIFGWKSINDDSHGSEITFWLKSAQTKISPVTLEEQKAFDDFCKSQGEIWNKEKLRWEKCRWQPKKNDSYFTILISRGTADISRYLWDEDELDTNLYKMGNCFKTRKEAEAKLEQIKKLLLEV